MSVGPLSSIAGSVAGTQLAQQGAESDRARAASSSQQRQTQSAQLAEAAAGIGKTDGDQHETNERDADGRRPWEIEAEIRAAAAAKEAAAAEPPRQSRDATGQCGSTLDLTG